jgi:hypothetical protein
MRKTTGSPAFVWSPTRVATSDALRKCRVILPDHHISRNLGVLVLRYVAALYGLHPATNAITLDVSVGPN